ncbi:MAG TPA: c-type cytochrome [Burkholderiaceae bacterium]|nr:c-type cytochrome [Burkholderiaceae bacterium]
MSDAHDEHQSGNKTPQQLIAMVAAGFLVPIITIILLVQFATSGNQVGAGSDGQAPEAIAARLKPVADEGFTLKDASAPRVLKAGAEVFKTSCAACHATGAAGAPKAGDAAAWSARIAQGYDKLVSNAINGIRAMPPKGGNPDLDNLEVASAVVYMANQSGAKFKEPDLKAAQPAAAAPAAADAAVTPAAAAPAKVSADAGKKLYEASCQACHGSGIAGAPKFGDKAAWAPRIKQGNATLYSNAINGFQGKTGVMPPRGGAAASDEEVKAAVDYMVAASK